jgi:hypothetical protein
MAMGRPVPAVAPATAQAARYLALEVVVLYENQQATAEVLSEVLMMFSPRVTYRHGNNSGRDAGRGSGHDSGGAKIWFFLDLGTHTTWIQRNFGTEARLMEGVFQKLTSLDFQARAAIADTAPAAQAFAAVYSFWISSPGRTKEDLERLPLQAMSQLEGLIPWEHPSRVETVANFFTLLGFSTLADLRAFTPAAFHERWGEMGDRLYRRLQGRHDLDPQPIAPYIPVDALKSYIHLDFPVSIVSLLLHEVEGALKRLLARLEGRRLMARRLRLKLRCEYSGHEHVFSIEPSTPTRDLRFFRVLLENRLERIELLNPIQDLELEIDPTPERETQDGFLDRTTMDETKLAILTSLLGQEGATAGFAEMHEHIWPENTWMLNPDMTKAKSNVALVADLGAICSVSANTSFDADAGANAISSRGLLDETGFSPRFQYGQELKSAPRPTLLLKKPRALSADEIAALHFYSGRPVERLEHGWWEERAGPQKELVPEGKNDFPLGHLEVPRRDYYIARDKHGRILWVFQDPASDTFYLHGAFD